MLYTGDSDQNTVNDLGMNITSILTQYTMKESIESEITLTVLQNVSMNGTLLECKSEDLAVSNQTVYVNSSGNSIIAAVHKILKLLCLDSSTGTLWL